MKIFSLSCLLLLALAASLAPAQASLAHLSDAERLERIFAYARQYRERMPSFEVDALIASQRVKDGKVKKEVRLGATLRELRDSGKPDEFKDQYVFKTLNDKPTDKQVFRVPYWAVGGFVGIVGLTGPADHACVTYRFRELDGGATLELVVEDKPETAASSACKDQPHPYRKRALFDMATGSVKRIERSLPTDFAAKEHDVPSAVADFAPQRLGDQLLWLPVRIEIEDTSKKGREIVTYSNFHRYAGEVKILPQSEQIAADVQ